MLLLFKNKSIALSLLLLPVLSFGICKTKNLLLLGCLDNPEPHGKHLHKY